MTTANVGEILVFARLPKPGRVKTRLVPPLTHTQAALLYEAFVVDTLSSLAHTVMASMPVTTVIYLADGNDLAEMESLLKRVDLGAQFELHPQADGDLGCRLASAFADSFARGARAVCAVGTDHPTLPPERLEQAFMALKSSDLVIGPAQDGGYYLIGLSNLSPQLFADMPWSTPELLEATRKRAALLGLSVALLEPWYDVDNAADLQRLCGDIDLLPQGSRTALLLPDIMAGTSQARRRDEPRDSF